jgi:hypothetical protein
MKKDKNVEEFRRLYSNLPEYQQKSALTKLVDLANRSEHENFLKCILLGAYLILDQKISVDTWNENGEPTKITVIEYE